MPLVLINGVMVEVPSIEISNDVGNPIPINDSTDFEYSILATSITTAGDNLLLTPATGKRLRLHWVYAINDPTASTPTKITIKLGTTAKYVAWAISKRQQITGAIGESLIINLSNNGDVAVTIFYEEI